MGRPLVLLVVAACSGSDTRVDPDAEAPASWQLASHSEPAALLGVWGSDTNDVWVVGGRSELAGPPTVLRYDGAWSRVATPVSGIDLWWVFGSAADDVFFGGSAGTILRWRGDSFEQMATPRTGIVFGIWGASATDVWAVGDGGAGGGIVWRFDGTAWRDVPLPDGTPSRIFKVHGRAADDVWMACGDGSVLHWNGQTLERHATGLASPLFSVVATSSHVVAVGGSQGVGEIVERDAAWSAATLESPVAWRGAAVRDDAVYAVGEYGVVAARDASGAGWRHLDQQVIREDFHGAWIDPAGGLWAVGGQFNRAPLTLGGFITYFGSRHIEEVSP